LMSVKSNNYPFRGCSVVFGKRCNLLLFDIDIEKPPFWIISIKEFLKI
jgi:hypothetical protein